MFRRLLTALCLCYSVAILLAASPKYVFLFIGDGMGAPIITLGTNAYGNDFLLGTLRNVGLTTTHSANSTVTDSAASGTALAAGYKTNNGYLGMTPDKKLVESNAVFAAKTGRKVGIISSVAINHATPAAFYAHVSSRSMYYEIACQLAASGFDYFAGGGVILPTGIKNDQPDAFGVIEKAGYKIVDNLDAFNSLKAGQKALVVPSRTSNALEYEINRNVLADWSTLTDYTRMEYDVARKSTPVWASLADYTRKAIEVLDNPKGFFMMVEGGLIDYAAHDKDAATALGELYAFDQAIKEAVKFADKHPGEVLIVITADHETGALALGCNYGANSTANAKILTGQKVSRSVFSRQLEHAKKAEGGLTLEKAQALFQDNFGVPFTKLNAAQQELFVTA